MLLLLITYAFNSNSMNAWCCSNLNSGLWILSIFVSWCSVSINVYSFTAKDLYDLRNQPRCPYSRWCNTSQDVHRPYEVWMCFCAVGGVDRTQCCESKGVRGHCLGACSGNIDDLPDNLFDCQRHLYSVASCYGVTPPTGLPPGPSLCYFSYSYS